MTREEILAMKPSRELDRLVAEHIMGFHMYHYDKDIAENCYYCLLDGLDPVAGDGGNRQTEAGAWEDCPNYSTDIAAAFDAIEKANVMPLSISRTSLNKPYQTIIPGWAVNWCIISYACDDCDAECQGDSQIALENAPEAICKALLLIKLEEEQNIRQFMIPG